MIVNGDFEQQLQGWRIVSGPAFDGQPVLADSIRAQDVRIGRGPVVTLGGDFWHLPYPMGNDGKYLIRTVGKLRGVLDSDEFRIDDPWLVFRLGGSKTGGAALELRVPQTIAQQTPGFRTLDAADANGFVAVRRAKPTGSDPLREISWNLGGGITGTGLLGAPARIRLRISGPGTHRLLVDAIRLLPDAPPPFRPELWGWADLHCHPMAQAGFGGLMAGHMHGPVEDLGSCVLDHGVDHASLLHPVPAFAETSGRGNDGSLTVPGWATGKVERGEQFGFSGWPQFDDLTHIKVHQDWIRRAYDGGQRLMVALVVHSELLATAMGAPQTDRDTVEPQVRMLREFVTHNGAWCGLARTPADARTLVEANKLAFVLGLETDSINNWIKESDLPTDPQDLHAVLHEYFKYLHELGIVQVNLLHLSNNAFGGMALYDFMFMFNTLTRTGQLPMTEDDVRTDDERISRKVTTGSTIWGHLDAIAIEKGFPPPSPLATAWTAFGHRNQDGLTAAGEIAVLEAMRFGMVIDLDHMSEYSAAKAHEIATTTLPMTKYPLVSAHNGARRMAPRALNPTQARPAGASMSEFRRASENYPTENAKSDTQLGWIKETGGMFGHGTAGGDSRDWPLAPVVSNDCPGTDKTFAQGFEYVRSVLKGPVGLGTDWNSLLAGPGPRFGPRAAHSLKSEAAATVAALRSDVWVERRDDARAQDSGVLYTTPLRDARRYRFPDHGLYDGTAIAGQGHWLWQATAMIKTNLTVEGAVAMEDVDEEVIALVQGISGLPNTTTSPNAADFFTAGSLFRNPPPPAILAGMSAHVQALTAELTTIDMLWTAMTTPHAAPAVPPGMPPAAPPPAPQLVRLVRSTAGTIRDFDYNLDGLAHYGMLPDMFQDLRNLGFPEDALTDLFKSAEQYIKVWEASEAVSQALPHP